jgi:aminoglycoside phosphotransferase (APT) family kinase protein
MTQIDQPTAIREGEELDLQAIDSYLKALALDLTGTPVIRQFPGGASNLTYQIDYPGRSFVLRRPPFGHLAKSAHDMLREARIMQALKPVYPYVPTVIALCDDHSLIGCDFYIMERLEGIILRQDFPPEFKLDPTDTRRLCLNVIDKLVELHQVDIRATGLDQIGKGTGYVERQIAGWSERFRKAHTEDVSDCETVMAWLAASMPADSGQCLIHNDYRFDNVILDPTDPFRVIGVLDWEMATIGDPLMDLGNSLAYWIQADDEPGFQMMRRQPTHRPGMLSRHEVIDYYLQRSGRNAVCFDFYEIYGLFRLAVILQQIYYRYHHGQTRDRRFAGFGPAVNYLDQRCQRLISARSR